MDGTKLQTIDYSPGQTIWDAYNSDLVPKHLPILCLIGEDAVMRADWGQLVNPASPPVFVSLPMGDGGFKNIIKIVALVAIAVAAPYIAPLIVGAAASAALIGGVAAGITLVGGLVLNMILPAQAPPGPAGSSETSPSYFTQAQGARARLLQPVPVQYGYFKMVPDWASDPFVDYNDNQQRIYQLLCCGAGYFDHHSVLVGDTEVWNDVSGYTGNLSSVTLQWIEPGQPVTLFPGLVHTSTEVGGQDLRRVLSTGDFTLTTNRATFADSRSDAFNEFLVGDTVFLTAAGANNGTYLVTALDPGTTKGWAEFSPNFPAPGAVSGATFTVKTEIGPFAACDAGDVIYKICFDISAPGGLGEANDDGGIDDLSVTFQISYQLIDNLNNPIGPWINPTPITITGNTPQPRRYSFSFDVTQGRYWGKIQRTSSSSLKTGILDDISWIGLRGFIPDDNIYSNVTLLAILFNVGDQITQASSRQISVIQTRKLPIWSAGVWSAPVATRSIAWAAADMVRNTLYGAAQPDSFLDLPKLVSLDATWTATGDSFDGVFDSQQVFWDALVSVLKVGRAFPLLYGSNISFDRDEVKTLVKGVITPRTILSDSFSMDTILFDEDSPDDVIIEFFNKDIWANDEIQCTLPGSLSTKPARYQVFGIIERTQAWSYGMYQAASNFYRRTLVGCDTEMVGRLYLRNTLVLFSHDMPQWGYAGDIYQNTGVRQFELSDPIDWSTPDTYYMAVRKPMEGSWGPVVVTKGSADNVILVDATSLAAVEAVQGPMADILIYDDDDDGREPSKYIIGAGLTTFARKFLVSTTQPNGLDSVSVLLQNYDENVYTDFGPPPPAPVTSGPGVVPDKPVVLAFYLSQSPNSRGDVVTLFGSWQPAPGANTYVVDISYDNVNWSQVYNGTAAECQFQATSGTLFARCAGVGKLRGDYATVTGTYGSPTSPPGAISGLTVALAADGTITANWGAAARALSYQTRILTETVLGSGTYNVLKLSKDTAFSPAVFGPAEVGSAGGPWTRFQAQVHGINTVGNGPIAIATYATSVPTAPVILGGPTIYTSDHTPLISGTSIPFANITVAVDLFTRATTTANLNGAWSVVLPAQITGTHSLTATQTTPGGTSAASIAVSAVIYDEIAATTAYLAAMTVQPIAKRKYDINVFLSAVASIWSKFDGLYLIASHDAQASRLNAKAPANFAYSASGSPTFTANHGYKGSGSGTTAGGYLAGTFNPATATTPNFVQDNAHMAIFIRTASTTSLGVTMSEMGNVNARGFAKNATAGDWVTRLNDATNNTVAAGGASTGFFASSRAASTSYARYHDGTTLTAATVTSTGVSSNAIDILRASAGTYSDAEVSFASFGSALTAGEVGTLRAALLVYNAAVGV